MAQGNGHRVGDIVRPWDSGETQKPPGHLHNLAFLCLSIARHRLLYLGGRVFKDGDSGPLRRRQDNAPGLGHADASGDIVVEEKLLHRHGPGPEGLQELGHVIFNLDQPGGQRPSRWRGDGAAAEQPLPPPVPLQHPKAHNGKAGVDA